MIDLTTPRRETMGGGGEYPECDGGGGGGGGHPECDGGLSPLDPKYHKQNLTIFDSHISTKF